MLTAQRRRWPPHQVLAHHQPTDQHRLEPDLAAQRFGHIDGAFVVAGNRHPELVALLRVFGELVKVDPVEGPNDPRAGEQLRGKPARRHPRR